MTERSQIRIKQSLKKAVYAIGGEKGMQLARAARFHLNLASTQQVGVNDTPIEAPPRPGTYGQVQTDYGPVRVMPARAELEPGTGTYPAAPPAPRVPKEKKPAWWSDLEYFPRWHTDGHPTRWEFPAYLDNPGCKWLQVLKRLYENPLSFPSSLSPEAGLMVHSLVRNIRPRRVIETGSFIGISTLWIAAALKENGDGGLLRCFDDFGPIHKAPHRDAEMLSGRLEFVAGNVAEAGLAEHVALHPGNSSFEIRAAHAEIKAEQGIQLAFIDADHGIQGVWQDLWAVEPVLQIGGFVLFHDTFPPYCAHEGPRHLLDHLNKHAVGVYEKVDLYLAPINYGLGLVRRIG